jgi:hypothetical protein
MAANDNTSISLAEARRRAGDTARAEATLRADATWQNVYIETFSRIYDETLVELLADQKTEADRTQWPLYNVVGRVAA